MLISCARNQQARILGPVQEGDDIFFPDGNNNDFDPFDEDDDEPVVEVPAPEALACVLTISPAVPTVNQPYSIFLTVTSGTPTSWSINNQTAANKVLNLVAPATPGNQLATGSVSGGGVTTACPVKVYSVAAAPVAPVVPQCTVTKVTTFTEPGQPIVFTISGQGGALYLNDQLASSGSVSVLPLSSGAYLASGQVRNPTGTALANCGILFTPPTCDLALEANSNSRGVSLRMSNYGTATLGTLDGVEIALSGSSKVINLGAKSAGAYSALATFRLPSNDIGFCRLDYNVVQAPTIYTVTPTTFCGSSGAAYETTTPPVNTPCESRTQTWYQNHPQDHSPACTMIRQVAGAKGTGYRDWSCTPYLITAQ